MTRKTIAVIFGGNSSEYDVSLQSAYAVISHLNPIKYQIIMLGITRQGQWLKFDGNALSIKNDTWSESGHCLPAILSPDRSTHGILVADGKHTTVLPVDAAFPVLHGKNGEDGTIQGLLDLSGIPYVGCGTLSSAICMDKEIAHKLVQHTDVQTTPSVVLHTLVDERTIEKQTAHLQYPLFVKPANAGSSFGVTRVTEPSELLGAATAAFEHDRKVIIEQAVEGFEVGCAILGNDMLTIGEIDEIELSHGFLDYTEKYTLKSTRIHVPARMDEELASRIKQAAASIYRALGCRGLARVDLFVTPEKELFFNEVNTIPGFTAHSRYPTMLKEIGLTFSELVDELIRLAMEP